MKAFHDCVILLLFLPVARAEQAPLCVDMNPSGCAYSLSECDGLHVVSHQVKVNDELHLRPWETILARVSKTIKLPQC